MTRGRPANRRATRTVRARAFRLVLSTCPDMDSAQRIAHALVSERLAACVNIVPIAQSIYRWGGKIESATEQLLIIKSRARDFRAIEKRVHGLHPYELPELLAVPIGDGSQGYLAWLANPDKPA
jgi:periplasmic divalent cation tolerance protein